MIRTTPPFEATGPICGIERKNRPVTGSHTGCSAPPVASTPWAAFSTNRFAKVGGVRAQLALLTVIKVPKGVGSLGLITRSSAVGFFPFGSYASYKEPVRQAKPNAPHNR